MLQEKGVYKPTAGVIINDFNINNRKLGLFKLDIEGDEEFNKYHINTSIENESVKSLNASGYVDFAIEKPYLNLDVDLNQLDLSFLVI